jgi:hypothetical protein
MYQELPEMTNCLPMSTSSDFSELSVDSEVSFWWHQFLSVLFYSRSDRGIILGDYQLVLLSQTLKKKTTLNLNKYLRLLYLSHTKIRSILMTSTNLKLDTQQCQSRILHLKRLLELIRAKFNKVQWADNFKKAAINNYLSQWPVQLVFSPMLYYVYTLLYSCL